MDSLPPDPYGALGVTREATLAEIKKAYRKLVLKCHPDKVQDKQDEFQKVQQAYEIIGDEPRRSQYHEQVKLFELRKEMGGRNATARSNPFEYEDRTGEPRGNTYSRSAPSRDSRDSPKSRVYTTTPPRSHEDVLYEEPLRTSARKNASYESERKRGAAEKRDRDDERDRELRKQHEEIERHRQDDKARAKYEKETKRAAHGERKKNREKEKRRGADEKQTRAKAAYVEEELSDDYPPREKKSSRRAAMEEADINESLRGAAESRAKEIPLPHKWDAHKEYASQYMKASHRKGDKEDDTRPIETRPAPLRRSETTAAPSMRYAVPQPAVFAVSDDDSPRRSSGRSSRRSPEAPRTQSRDLGGKSPSREKERRRKSPTPSREMPPHIVEPPSPAPITKPGLYTYATAPPSSPHTANSSSRREASRSNSQPYPRNNEVPPAPLPRSRTFASGDREGSRLKKSVEYDDEIPSPERATPIYASRHSHSPEPSRSDGLRPEFRRRDTGQTQSRYRVDDGGRTIPIGQPTHLNDMVEEVNRERSASPRASPRLSGERPPLSRADASVRGSRGSRTRSQSQNYYPEAPEPIALRPAMSSREQSYRQPSVRQSPLMDNIKFAPSYAHADVQYSNRSVPTEYKRTAGDSHHRDYSYPAVHRGGRGEVYA